MYFNTNESVDLNQLEMEIQTFKEQREETKEMVTLQTWINDLINFIYADIDYVKTNTDFIYPIDWYK